MHFIHIPKNAGTSFVKLCRENKNITYNYHNVNVFDTKITDQMIIIRDPIKRFISAVYYGLEKWSNDPIIKKLINNNINTPEKWIQIWMNKDHIHHNLLMSELLNKNHKIGDNILEYKWTYTPQYKWVNNPKYIIIMDNLYEELKYMNINIQHHNKTSKNNTELTKNSIDFLKDFYRKDFILYEKYKNIPIEKRIPIY